AALSLERADGGLVYAVEHLQQGRLARAVAADEAEPVPGPQLEADIVERGDVASPAAGEKAAADGGAGVALQLDVPRHRIAQADICCSNGNHGQSWNTICRLNLPSITSAATDRSAVIDRVIAQEFQAMVPAI